jgi:hypothetical protein
MLEQLLNLVKENAGQSVVNNPDVPNEHNNDVIAEATKTVAGGLQNMAAGGGLQNILSMFTGGGNQGSSGLMSNPIVNMMIGHFSGKLMSKFGLGGNQANGVASQLIPNVISGLINKTNDPSNNGFSIEGLLNSITGGQATQAAQQSGGGLDIGSLIGQFTGGGNAGGGGGLMDLVGKIAGGASSARQQQGGGGGLLDMIKGFLK